VSIATKCRTDTQPESGSLGISDAAQHRRSVSTLGLDRNELGAFLVQAGLCGGRDHALACLLALNGLRISEALGADISSRMRAITRSRSRDERSGTTQRTNWDKNRAYRLAGSRDKDILG
jgi:hypothetical protein